MRTPSASLVQCPARCSSFTAPIGSTSIYVLGDPARLGRAETRIACRVHDECNGSDVFGSDICTCRPYLAYGVEVCVATAQQGGVGIDQAASEKPAAICFNLYRSDEFAFRHDDVNAPDWSILGRPLPAMRQNRVLTRNEFSFDKKIAECLVGCVGAGSG